METKIHHGNSSAKVAESWRLEGILERLAEIFDPGLSITFNHVKKNGNKAENRLANLGTETQITIKYKD